MTAEKSMAMTRPTRSRFTRDALSYIEHNGDPRDMCGRDSLHRRWECSPPSCADNAVGPARSPKAYASVKPHGCLRFAAAPGAFVCVVVSRLDSPTANSGHLDMSALRESIVFPYIALSGMVYLSVFR